MSEYILETEDLTKEFAGFVAVNGVNLRVERGTIHALIGPNGAGKTTCFNLLTKFLQPTRGRITYKGADITAQPPAEVARLEGRARAMTAKYMPACPGRRRPGGCRRRPCYCPALHKAVAIMRLHRWGARLAMQSEPPVLLDKWRRTSFSKRGA